MGYKGKGLNDMALAHSLKKEVKVLREQVEGIGHRQEVVRKSTRSARWLSH